MKQAQVHGASIASSQINGEIILSDGQRCTYIGSMPKINLLAISATKQIRPWLVRACAGYKNRELYYQVKSGLKYNKLLQGSLETYKVPLKLTSIMGCFMNGCF